MSRNIERDSTINGRLFGGVEPIFPHVGGDVGIEVRIAVVQGLGQAEKETPETT